MIWLFLAILYALVRSTYSILYANKCGRLSTPFVVTEELLACWYPVNSTSRAAAKNCIEILKLHDVPVTLEEQP